MSLPIQRSPELSFYYCLQTSSLSLSIFIQRSPKLTLVVHSKCSTLQPHSFVYLYQMLAGLLSLYQLVCLCFYLYQMLAELLSISVSVSIYVSLSIQRSPEHSFYYCLQSSSPSLPNSVADSRPSLQAELSTPPFNTSRQHAHAHVKAWRQRLTFWVFVAGEFDRQTDNGIIIIDI